MDHSLNTILSQAADGDQAAWRTIVREYGPRVFGLVRAQCKDPDLAEEISQSVFCTVAEKIGSEGGYTDQGRFESWLFRIAVNRLRDEMRRRKRQAVTVGTEVIDQTGTTARHQRNHVEDFESEDENSRQLTAMREAMEQLAPADREILELRHRAGLSFKQIAELLDEPIGTVLARQHRALKKLKSTMEQHERQNDPTI